VGSAGMQGFSGSGGELPDAGLDSGGSGSIARSWSINASAFASLRDIATDGTRVIAAATIAGDVSLGGTRLSIDVADVAVVAFDGRGDYAWHRIFDATLVEHVALEADPAGNAYVAGIASSITFDGDRLSFDPDRALFVAKLSPSGDVLWSKGFRFRLTDQAELSVALGVDAQGGVLLSGSVVTGGIDFGAGHVVEASTPLDSYLVKLDPSGNASWVRRFSGFGKAVIGVDGSGAAILATVTSGEVDLGGPVPQCSTLGRCLTIAGFDPAGTRTWLGQWPGLNDLNATGVAAVGGSVLVTVQSGVDFGGGVVGSYERIQAMLGENGAFRWARTSSHAAEEWGTISASGTVYVAGFFWELNTVGGTLLGDIRNLKALYLAGYDATGSQRFARVIGAGHESNEIIGIVATESGPVIGGNYRSRLDLDRNLAGDPEQYSIFFVRSAP
jgi:hypothetical protein